MKIEEGQLKSIEEYYFSTDDKESRIIFRECYEKIRNCDCIKEQEEDLFLYCLNLIAFDISSNRFFRTASIQMGQNIYELSDESRCKSIVCIIFNALYETYGEKAIDSLKPLYGDVSEEEIVEKLSEKSSELNDFNNCIRGIRETEISNARIRRLTM